MKVALVHDYIKEYGGAERVLEALHELYPNATVYTSVYLPEFLGPHKERFSKWKIKTSFLQYIPGKAKLISPFRLLAPFVFQQFDLSSYDVIIVSATGAYFPNLVKVTSNKRQVTRKPVQICYCHTPPRYLYGYMTARDWRKNKILNILGEAANHILRIVDGHASNHVDYFVANSEEVAARIKKFYRRDSTVIYPPVEIHNSKFIIHNSKNSRSYFLTGGRLARAKHVDIIVRTATKLGLQLKVFGKGFAGYGTELEMMAGPTVTFVGEVSDEEKSELMRGAKAFIFASEDEDFGIVPVEAMGEGAPVIAYRSGGVKETVIDGQTGIFFDELTIDSLSDAIRKFEKSNLKSADCINQAKKFSKEKFMKEMKAFVTSKIKSQVPNSK
jgi:glycosyltransferase involved in cell wall biosynthesis